MIPNNYLECDNNYPHVSVVDHQQSGLGLSHIPAPSELNLLFLHDGGGWEDISADEVGDW